MRFFSMATLLVLSAAWIAPAQAHYHMLIPNKASAKTDESIGFAYQFGHPYEHQLFDTHKPTELYVLSPDGTKTDLLAKLEKIEADGGEGKKVTGYKFVFTPAKRGDYTFVAVSPEVKVEGEAHPLRDVAKVVLHVQTQNGWDCRALTAKGSAVEVSPLTRPYGLKPGVAFRVEADEPADGERKSLSKLAVEFEKYNTKAPKELPEDEQITGTARTARSGDAVVTLSETGWWGITALREREKIQHRCTLWVYVDEKAPVK